MHIEIPDPNLRGRFEQRLALWSDSRILERLWRKDFRIWFPEPRPEITDRLGWLDLPARMLGFLEEWQRIAHEVRDSGIRQIILLGMGGSSLAPEVFSHILPAAPGQPRLSVLDSTHPEEVRRLDGSLDLRSTLFLVSSKSGTTLETMSLMRYFWKRMGDVEKNPGYHFAAITDPGSALESLAREQGFRWIFLAPADVGGRYSALSPFGLVPASLAGLDTARLLEHGARASTLHAPELDPAQSPGVRLGALLGEAAPTRDKISFIASKSLSAFPVWLEQLIAESTGKQGVGLVPVTEDGIQAVDDYGPDRLFVFLMLGEENVPAQEELSDRLVRAGHPVVWMEINDRAAVTEWMYTWEAAVALASSLLGVNPFDQPDVQLAKELARRAMQDSTPDPEPDGMLSIFDAERVSPALNDFFTQAGPGDFVAVQAFLPRISAVERPLMRLGQGIRRHTGAAFTLGFGPRFLHSTGQLHKGGPPSGRFLQVVDEPEVDIPVPETDYSFGRLIAAQARGDYFALRQRGRPALRVSLGRDRERGLDALYKIVKSLGSQR
jgi:transaldolase/glucose-6-phosphate isomerase